MLTFAFVSAQAHRAMLSSTVIPRPTPTTPVDIASLNINVPVPSPAPAAVAAVNAGRERDPQLVRRVRELEEEVRHLRNENEKQVRPSIPRVDAAVRTEVDPCGMHVVAGYRKQ